MEAEMEEDKLGANEMEWKRGRGRRKNGGETYGPEEGGGGEEKAQKCAREVGGV